ncbi:MAG: type III pantothenate kinase [Acidimicrobiales bacterium]
MLLAIDVGNTETVIGLYALTPDERATVPWAEVGAGIGIGTEHEPSHGLTHHWRLSTVPTRTRDEHAVLLTQILDLEGIDIAATVDGIVVSSSVPSVTAELRQMASRWLGDVPCVVLGPGVKNGMPILYDSPKEVGADRVANAVAAFDLYGGPCVVVDLGTATTFDAISAEGEYLGGAITPGVAISLEALFQHAAALRRVELVEPRDVIGRSTAESIRSGVLYGFSAQVDGMCRRFVAALGPSTVVATGGLSELVAPFAEAVDHIEPWLTLHGLRVVYERNVPGTGAAGAGTYAAGAGRAPAAARPAREAR